MTRALLILLLACLSMSAAWGVTVDPQDSMISPRIVGGMNGGLGSTAKVTIWGAPIVAGDIVQVRLMLGSPTLGYCAGATFSGVAAAMPPGYPPGTFGATVNVADL